METYLLILVIENGLSFLTTIFKILRKSECMMCGCCHYKTNNDDDYDEDYDEDPKPKRRKRVVNNVVDDENPV